MGAHFHKHAVERGLNPASQLDEIMEFCQLTIVASVEPGLPDSQARLDRLEAGIQNRLMTMEMTDGGHCFGGDDVISRDEGEGRGA